HLGEEEDEAERDEPLEALLPGEVRVPAREVERAQKREDDEDRAHDGEADLVRRREREDHREDATENRYWGVPGGGSSPPAAGGSGAGGSGAASGSGTASAITTVSGSWRASDTSSGV